MHFCIKRFLPEKLAAGNGFIFLHDHFSLPPPKYIFGRNQHLTKIYIKIYTIIVEVITVDTAKVFETGRSQAVRLPKKFRFSVDEVAVQQLGDAVLLAPKESVWKIFMDGLDGFTSDIFDGGRDQGIQKERETL